MLFYQRVELKNGLLATALMVAVLVLNGCGSSDPVADDEVLTAAQIAEQWGGTAHLANDPVRPTGGLALHRLGWTYDCMECHRLLTARWHHDRPLVEHRDLVLEHGANRFCLNCHHPTNRNAFVDYDGAEIAEQDVVLLCAKCHGPTYRDWTRGIHGRQTGSWQTPVADRPRLRCIQCHDPHRPTYPLLTPESAPTYPVRAAGGHAPVAAHAAEQEH